MGDDVLDAKLERLREALTLRTPALLACSGGLDSRFLAHMARRWNLDVAAVFVTGPHLTPQEIAYAKDWIVRSGMPLHLLQFNPLHDEHARQNLRDRCYHCKRAIFTRIRLLAEDLGRPYVLDGTNFSDTQLFRPGSTALKELDIMSPMALAGLEKADIRTAARQTGMELPDQPSRSCLMTRLDYGIVPTEALLARLALAEDALARLGLRQFRVRISPPLPGEGGMLRYALHIAQEEQDRWVRIRAQGVAALRLEGFFPCKVRLVDSVHGFFDGPPRPDAEKKSGQDTDE
ncbi:ATP-dependent sacrificial sulfur transferase LarE [Megalodesulfovibrio paquesii]